jgi:hypothetical protein
LVVGPGVVGIPVAHAILGIGPDINDLFDLFGDDDDNRKSKQHHYQPTADTGVQASRAAADATATEATQPVAKVGSEPANASRVSAPETLATAGSPESLSPGIREDIGGNEGGAVPRSVGLGRTSNLPPVPSAPVTRSIVIRAVPGHAGSRQPMSVPPGLSQAPVPMAAPVPGPQVPEEQQAPSAPPTPTPRWHAINPGAPGGSGIGRTPDSFRAGYAEYLRSANTSDLVVAALPGVAGIAGFTLVGAYAGYRQARALRAALLAPVPTRVLL